jgi:hypothetical protein
MNTGNDGAKALAKIATALHTVPNELTARHP